MNRKERRASKKAAHHKGRSTPRAASREYFLIQLDAAESREAAGDIDGAITVFESLLKSVPGEPEVLFRYGMFLLDQNHLDDAIRMLTQAARKAPDSASAHAVLANALTRRGDREGAAKAIDRASTIAPDNPDVRRVLFDIVKDRRIAEDEHALHRHLPALLTTPGIAPTHLLEPIISLLEQSPGADVLLAAAPADIDGERAYRLLAACPAFLTLICLTLINDIRVEEIMVAARHHLLERWQNLGEEALPTAAALAQQCYLNEYMFAEEEDETAKLDKLARHLETAASPLALCVFGTYRPLNKQTFIDNIDTDSFPTSARRVIDLQVSAPAERARLARSIECLTTITDQISEAVHQQYEENPYPRWVVPTISEHPLPLASYLRTAPGVGAVDLSGISRSPRILIAGCGTGRHPIFAATSYEGAQVLAIDLSTASLAYAQQQAGNLGLNNISFAQADILELSTLDERFDVIESSGVLHHLRDPLAGWRVLAGLLKNKGIMKIGLYSDAGRAGERRAQAIVEEMALTPDESGIRRLREEVKARARQGDTLLASLTQALAFNSVSECRDLVFHVMEHRFTIPEISDALDGLNLRFLGFHLPNASYVAAFKELHGSNADLRSLTQWQVFEDHYPASFIGMYQFWCQKLA
tara:strand:- start:4920 stop:6854 length:1935 start_codon:yes stop_codon:yes gene_type:complete